MRRRDFITGLSSSLPFLAKPSSGSAQTPIEGRYAIVIGVDHVVGLPKLNDARGSAERVALWLKGEGFDVRPFYDDKADATKEVRIAQIKDEVAKLIDSGTCEKLVIYFSGHGALQTAGFECWLLTRALKDREESVSVRDVLSGAERSRIRNVVMISDACRSRIDGDIRGSTVWPTFTHAAVQNSIDAFYATAPGDFASEIREAQDATAQYRAIYTDCFLNAFRAPYKSMVRKVGSDYVIPNRSLQGYLAKEMAKKVPATSRQTPIAYVTSADDDYIGRLSNPLDYPFLKAEAAAPIGLDLASQHNLERKGALSLQSRDPIVVARLIELQRTMGLFDAEAQVRRSLQLGDLPFQTGVRVFGSNVVTVLPGSRGVDVEIMSRRDGDRPQLLQASLARDRRAGYASVMFEDLSTAWIMLLDGFVAHLVVDGGQIANISYLPSPDTKFWSRFAEMRRQTFDLHSAIAASARHGLFELPGGRSGERRTSEPTLDRYLESVGYGDPTIAIYYAYALSDARRSEEVAVLRSRVTDALGAEIFDLALLSGRVSADRTYFPPIPLLTRGWYESDEHKGPSLTSLNRFQPALQRGLWTSFGTGALIAREPPSLDGRVRG